MSKNDTQHALVPRLRFPEFQTSSPWEVEPLGKLGEFLSSLTGKTANDFDSGDATFIPYMNVFSNTFTDAADLRSVDVHDGESQNAVAKGDVFFTVSSETPEDAGMSSVLLEEITNCYLNSFCALFRVNDGRSPNPVFLGYLLRSAPVRTHLSRGAQGATRYNISQGVFRGVPLLIPPEPEQQKIAECLNSLDDLIAAKGRKLAALRDHKKGLMQQLFPREGETQPRLRFPEFQEASEWTPHKFGDFVVKSFYGTSASTSETGQYPVLRMGNMSDGRLDFTNLVYIDLDAEEFESFRLQKGDILLNRTNSRDLVGKISIFDRDSECIAASYIVSFRMDEKRIDPWFCNLMLNTQVNQARIKLLATPSISQANINPTTFRTSLDIAVPNLVEQQRIADCLSSLNAMIAAQAEKLDALRTHKRGLMQQLFPSPPEGH